MFEHDFVELEELKAVTENGSRVYNTPAGKLPSVTTVLGRAKAQSIMEWRRRVGEEEATRITTRAARRGTKVHQICEDFVLNKDIGEPTPDNLEMFLQLKPLLEENVGTVYGVESPLWSEFLGVAGRVDLVAEWKGSPAIIDFKTSARMKKEEWIDNYFMQTACYAVMFEERTGKPIPNIVVAIATDSGQSQLFEKKRDDWIWKAKDTIDRYK